jgi:streptogramin lyase
MKSTTNTTWRFCFNVPIVACLLAATPAWAFEEISVERLTIQARVHRLAHGMVFGFGSLWMTTLCGATFVRVEAANNEITDIRIYEMHTPQAIAVGEDSLWISDARKRTIFKINPDDYSVQQQVHVPLMALEANFSVGEGSIWVPTSEGSDSALIRLNAHSGTTEAQIHLPGSVSSVAIGYGSVWATGYANNELYRIDLDTNSLASRIKLHQTPRFVVAGEASIWVLNQGDASIQRLNPKTGELIATVATGLPLGSGNITTGGGYVWVSMPGYPVTQIDPKTNAVRRRYIGGHGLGGYISYGAESLWIAGGRVSRLQPLN